jgi:D-glucuronyl C5-epimerase C-terminus
MHRRGVLDDSARFHRMMDVVSVAIEIAEDQVPVVGGKVRPATTPYLVWYSYPGLGAFFQPVTTGQTVAHLLPRSTAPTDSILLIGEHLYRYALWREHGSLRFPVWEYQFTWTSGGITVEAPWISAMAHGLVMAVFAEAYHRTGLPLWKDRAFEVLNSFKSTGVMAGSCWTTPPRDTGGRSFTRSSRCGMGRPRP